MITIKASLLLLSLLSGETFIPTKASSSSTTILTSQPELTQEEKDILAEIELMKHLYEEDVEEYDEDFELIEKRLVKLQKGFEMEEEKKFKCVCC